MDAASIHNSIRSSKIRLGGRGKQLLDRIVAMVVELCRAMRDG
jgi:hypothetical protein